MPTPKCAAAFGAFPLPLWGRSTALSTRLFHAIVFVFRAAQGHTVDFALPNGNAGHLADIDRVTARFDPAVPLWSIPISPEPATNQTHPLAKWCVRHEWHKLLSALFDSEKSPRFRYAFDQLRKALWRHRTHNKRYKHRQ